MKIVVCAKIIKGEINPFDACALEIALRLSDDVTVVSMAPPSAINELTRLTRLGAKVISITDSAYAGSDTLATSYILSCAINKIDYDLIICGRQTIDGDTAQVGPSLATRLNINLITNVLDVSLNDNTLSCKTRIKDETCTLPALITVERINELRFPSIFSKAGTPMLWNNIDLKADLSKCGLNGSPTQVLKTFENEKGKRHCKFISFHELDSLIDDLLKKEKSGIEFSPSKTKLKSVWAIGKEVEQEAFAIAENVIVLDEKDPFKIAEIAKKDCPDVILWSADLWGRKNAPIVASLLETGLCADCTALENDGERLYMYRPALGGNIIAKIECKTKPQMATVRTTSDFADIIVSGGKGVANKIDKLEKIALKYNAELGASRGLVDMGKIPYSAQIGLTGKTVCPKIYIAIGISGAVHHTVAIENADAIIAINPDKDARIFEYADFGIIDEF